MFKKKVKDPANEHQGMTKAQWTLHNMKLYKVGYFMIAPFMLLFIVFSVIPVVASLFVSFTDYNMLQWPHFVGISNYTTLFLNDDLFIIALKWTLIMAIAIGPGSYLISFVVAWFINELSPAMRTFVVFVFYAPSLAGGMGVIWGYLFGSEKNAFINGWLLKLGWIEQPIQWFSNKDTMLPLVIGITLWGSLGTSFLAFIAGFQGIDRSLMEAGSVDGITNRWQELWYITLPSLLPQLRFAAVMSVTGSFGGSVVSSLCGSPPTEYIGYSISDHMGEYGGTRMEIGYSTAISFILFLIMLGSNLLVQKLLSKVGE